MPSSRLLLGSSRRTNASAHSKRIFQGFTSGQRLPTKAVKKLKPTHQVIQTNVGAKLELGFCRPKRPLSMTSKKSATDRRRRQNRNGRLVSAARKGWNFSRSKLGYRYGTSFPTRPLSASKLTGTKETNTAAAAP